MTSKVLVFIDGLEPKPIVCGVADMDELNRVGRFRYGKSYLTREEKTHFH
jgi:serine/threonine-protein kinase HipA